MTPPPAGPPAPHLSRRRSAARPTAKVPTPARDRLDLWADRACAAYLLLRGAVVLTAMAASFVVVAAVSGAWIEASWARAGAGLFAALFVPLLLRSRLRRAVARRAGAGPGSTLGGPWLLLACNVALLVAVCLGFSDTVGRSLRRRGDWFLGELDGPLPRRYRGLVATVSSWLERFDLPPEAQAMLPEAATAQIDRPPLEGGTPPPPRLPGWQHPLLGPRRALPPNASCRFGAPRPGPRPAECELGHCGIDLVQPEGSPVVAVQEGVVLRAQRDEGAGGIAGRFIVLSHRAGSVESYYVHLEEIRTDLRTGSAVRAGELIGTLGRTGTRSSGPQLHFALAVRQSSGRLYLDPEPLVRRWELPLRAATPLPGLARPHVRLPGAAGGQPPLLDDRLGMAPYTKPYDLGRTGKRPSPLRQRLDENTSRPRPHIASGRPVAITSSQAFVVRGGRR